MPGTSALMRRRGPESECAQESFPVAHPEGAVLYWALAFLMTR